MIDATAASARRALLWRETMLSAVVNAVMSVGFFLVVFGWVAVRSRSLAIDLLPQTFGMTCVGGLVPSFLLLAKIRKGAVTTAGPVPTRRAQALRVFVCAVVATPVLGGGAALLMLAFGPVTMPPLTALIVKSLFGGLVGAVTTPLILIRALGRFVQFTPPEGRRRGAKMQARDTAQS